MIFYRFSDLSVLQEQELEELSKSLFEEANKMVSTEARKKAQVEKELVETRTRLEMEDELINDLKEKLVKLAENSRKKRKKLSKLCFSDLLIILLE